MGNVNAAKDKFQSLKQRLFVRPYSDGLYAWYLVLLFCLVSGFLIQLFGSAAISPLYRDYQFQISANDSSYLTFVGYSITHGAKPYVDLYDHKGLYTFYFEALGFAMGGRVGLYILLSLCTAFENYFLIYALKELKAKPLPAIATVLLVSFTFALINHFGNQIGNSLTPWISLSLYLYVRAFSRGGDKHFYLANFFVGLMTGFCFTSRASEAIWGVAFVFAYLLYFIKSEKDIRVLYNALWCILGFALPVAIAFLIAGIGGYIPLMWEGNITQNFAYISTHKQDRTIPRLIAIAVLLAGYIFTFLNNKKLGNDITVLCLCLLTIDGIVQVATALLTSYLNTLQPLAIFLVGVTASLPFEKLKKEGKDGNKAVSISIASVLSIACLSLSTIWLCVYYIPGYSSEPSYSLGTYAQVQRVHEDLDTYIKSSPTFEEDDVFAFDGSPSVLLYLDKPTKCPYPVFTSWQGLDNPKVVEGAYSYIQNEKPVFIVESNVLYLDLKDTNPIQSYVDLHYTLTCEDAYIRIFELNEHLALYPGRF